MLFFTSSKVVALGERFQKTYRPSKPSIITFDYGAKCFLGRTKHILREEVRRTKTIRFGRYAGLTYEGTGNGW
jgi:hypothetical protein